MSSHKSQAKSADGEQESTHWLGYHPICSKLTGSIASEAIEGASTTIEVWVNIVERETIVPLVRATKIEKIGGVVDQLCPPVVCFRESGSRGSAYTTQRSGGGKDGQQVLPRECSGAGKGHLNRAQFLGCGDHADIRRPVDHRGDCQVRRERRAGSNPAAIG